MIKKLNDYLHTVVELSQEDRQFVRDTLSVRKIARGEFLLMEGDVSKTFYFNVDGFIRLFYNKDGEERTAFFYPENTFVSAYESFVRQKPSTLNLQAMEETNVVEISREASVKLLQFSPKFDVLARVIMEEELIMHQKIIALLLTNSPEERYEQLMLENPAIFQRVPQRYIASYMGVKPESLSRIKKRYLQRKS